MDFALLEKIFGYVSAIISVLVFLFTAVNFVIYKVNKHHRKISAEEEKEELAEKLEDSKDVFDLLSEIIPEAMKHAEAIPLIEGGTKKLFALSEIMLKCSEEGIDFESYRQFVNEEIEKLIGFSKSINKRA